MESSHAGVADREVGLPRTLIGSAEHLAPRPERARNHPRQSLRAVAGAPTAGLIAQMLLIAAIAVAVSASGVSLNASGWVVAIACGLIMNLALVRALSHDRAGGMSPADWVTLTRASLAVGVAALVAASFGEHVQVAVLLSLTSVALVLDAVDGWVARRTGTEGALGARFDGEVDAFLILVLSVYVARSAGAWVLAIGLARYAFFVAGWPLPWMRAPLPPRYWRKVVAATEGIVLAIAASDVLPSAPIQAALVVALVILAESFGRDVWWLWRHRNAAPSTEPARADATGAPASALSWRRDGTRAGSSIAAGLTVLAIVVVWAALIAPDQPGDITPTAFLRLPLEGLVLVVVGDEQPLAIVSGQGASHDVPVSVIAHDPAVLKRIGSWDWLSGLLPSPRAPVWPMSWFRDRFLTAFGPRQAR